MNKGNKENCCKIAESILENPLNIYNLEFVSIYYNFIFEKKFYFYFYVFKISNNHWKNKYNFKKCLSNENFDYLYIYGFV